MKKIIWQPSRIYGYNFGISLDRNFAREIIKTKVPAKRKNRLNEIGNEELKYFRFTRLNPYTFYEDSYFVKRINIGQDGVWLSTECNKDNIESLLKEETKPLEYRSHNVDTTKQAYVLMSLFDRWVDLANVIKDE
ncbi:MAG: hypothetical protein ACOCUU_01115 [Nanoarchaeota archaeon]